MRCEGREKHEWTAYQWLLRIGCTMPQPRSVLRYVPPKTFRSIYDIATSVRDRTRTITLKIKRVDNQ